MKNLILVRIDSDYCNYLRQFDDKVPYNFKQKKLRPFIGVLFKVNNCNYFAPLSSPKPKHQKMSTKIDFLKIKNGKLGAINFNNMLPVTENNIIKLDLNKICYTNDEEKYIKVLKEQIFWLNRNKEKIYSKSKKLYDKYINGSLNGSIAKRCCNFKLLEKKCIEYNKK
ncbi:MAG: type III toxin-antitoxin system ToxN/AbiQ family toxin [Bacilli bacterium]